MQQLNLLAIIWYHTNSHAHTQQCTTKKVVYPPDFLIAS